MQKIGEKQKRERRLHRVLSEHEGALMASLTEEWEYLERAAQRAKKRDELYRRAGESAAMIGRTILAFAAVGGVLVVAAVAPNIFAGIGRVKSYRRFFDREQFGRATKNLRQQGLIRMKKGTDGYEICLTGKGKERISEVAYGHIAVHPQEVWDGIWRIVLFDIPNKHRWARDCFRAKLKDMKFFQLQKSVFVTPYPCEKEISFLADLFQVSSGVRVAETTTMGDDARLRAHFGVSRGRNERRTPFVSAQT